MSVICNEQPIGESEPSVSSSEQSSKLPLDFDSHYNFEHVSTDCGYMFVATSKELEPQKPTKPVIVTFHDVGFNYRTSFERFFRCPKMLSILTEFHVVHVNAPGQEMFAKSIDSNLNPYPSMDQIAHSIGQVLQHFGIDECVAFGVGAGANILARFALMKPNLINGLFLVNVAFNRTNLIESLKGHAVAQILQSNSKLSRLVRKFTLGQYFSDSAVPLPVLANYYPSSRTRPHYSHPSFNSHNFGLFLEAFLKRTKLNLQRNTKSNISCAVLLITSEHSSSVDDTMKMAAKLNPVNSSFLKVPASVDAMRDNQVAVANALQLFLQGLGYIRSYRLVGLEGDDISE